MLTYGGIHACKAMRQERWASRIISAGTGSLSAGIPIVNVPGCPVQPDNFTETLLYLLYQVAGRAPMIPLDKELRPTMAFGKRFMRAAIALATTNRGNLRRIRHTENAW